MTLVGLRHRLKHRSRLSSSDAGVCMDGPVCTQTKKKKSKSNLEIEKEQSRVGNGCTTDKCWDPQRGRAVVVCLSFFATTFRFQQCSDQLSGSA